MNADSFHFCPFVHAGNAPLSIATGIHSGGSRHPPGPISHAIRPGKLAARYPTRIPELLDGITIMIKSEYGRSGF
jgi:hypothetical protein